MMLLKTFVLPMMPMYMCQLNGKLDMKINKKGLEAMVDHPLAKEHLNNWHTIMTKNLPEEWLPGNDTLLFNDLYGRGFSSCIQEMEKEELGDKYKAPVTMKEMETLWYKYAKKFDALTEEEAYSPASEGTAAYAENKMA
jgi:hypothetical protein